MVFGLDGALPKPLRSSQASQPPELRADTNPHETLSVTRPHFLWTGSDHATAASRSPFLPRALEFLLLTGLKAEHRWFACELAALIGAEVIDLTDRVNVSR